MDMINVNGHFYVRGRAHWATTISQEAAKRAGDRWVAVPKSYLGTAFCSTLPEHFTHMPTGERFNAETSTHAGQPVIRLRDRTGTILIAATGAPYLLHSASATGTNYTEFSEWDAPVTITKPAKATELRRIIRSH
jgi:hypothetical protein